MASPPARCLFATGEAMPPLIGHDNKSRNVHYGEGASEGAYRTARLYSRVGVAFFGIPAGILTAIAIWLLVDFASDLAATWPQVLKFGAIAFALGLASTGLPVWAGLLAQSNPPESRLMMVTWAGLLALAGLAMLFFVIRMDAPQPLTEQATARAGELRKALRSVSTGELTVWNRSDNCRKARDADDQETCDAINARDTRYRAELAAIDQGTWRTGWTPRDVIGTGHVAGMSDVLRRLLAALFTLLAMAGAGVLARWGAMGHAEAFRQADGIVAAPGPGPSASAGNPPALISPLESTEMWLATRVSPMKGMRMRSSDGYADYLVQSEASGVNPLPKPAFYRWLAARVTAPDLRDKVKALKSNGNTVYDGLCLGTADMGSLSADNGDMLALPYRAE
jgi:hypothetical protein